MYIPVKSPVKLWTFHVVHDTLYHAHVHICALTSYPERGTLVVRGYPVNTKQRGEYNVTYQNFTVVLDKLVADNHAINYICADKIYDLLDIYSATHSNKFTRWYLASTMSPEYTNGLQRVGYIAEYVCRYGRL